MRRGRGRLEEETVSAGGIENDGEVEGGRVG